MGLSFNGRTARLHRADRGSIPRRSTKYRQCGREVRHRSEKPTTRVRFAALAPGFVWTVDQWPIERLWIFLRGFDSRRSNQVLLGVRLVASRWSLKPASGVRFVHSQPQRDRSAARISGSDPEDSGSNPLPAAKVTINGGESAVATVHTRASFNWIRTLGYEPRDLKVRVLPPVPFFGPSSKGLGHSPPKAGIGVRVAGGRPGYARETDWRGTRLSTGFRRVRFPFRAPKFMCRRARPDERPDPHSGDSGFDSHLRRHGAEHDWTSALSFKEVIAGSLPACPTKLRVLS
jgi:hypothetical protein